MARQSLFPVRLEAVVLAVVEDTLCVALERRAEQPQKGKLVLPGVDLAPDEELEAAASRAALESVGTAPSSPSGSHASVSTRIAGKRDPRAPLIIVTQLAVVAADVVAQMQPPRAAWWPVDEVVERPRTTAFDTVRMVEAAREALTWQLATTTVATQLCPAEFTIGELRRVYELVWGVAVDPRNFHRKMTTTEGLLSDTGAMTTRQGGRPARLYTAGDAVRLVPPMPLPAV